MKEKTNCKIVQDLLPNYIEKLTNEETNKYIEEHLKDCKECNKILEDMQNDLKLNVTKMDNREVKYIKKFSNKMKILKTIILIIIAIFIISTGIKMSIILRLQKNTNEYVESTNYLKTVYSYEKDTYTKNEIYKLDDKILVVITKVTDGEKTVTKMYKNNDKVNIYIETENEKIAKLNQNGSMFVEISNVLHTENFAQLLIASITSTIKREECNGKECFYIDNFLGAASICEDGAYIDSKTGLIVRKPSSVSTLYEGGKYINPVIDYEYEFDTVTEADFIEPNISEYEIQ